MEAYGQSGGDVWSAFNFEGYPMGMWLYEPSMRVTSDLQSHSHDRGAWSSCTTPKRSTAC